MTPDAIETELVPAGAARLAYRRDGPRSDAPVVLIHGLGQTLVDWPDALVQGLIAEGHEVVRFDNRDVGRSQRFDQLGAPPLLRLWAAAALRLPSLANPPYGVGDMVADTVGLLDALGVARAHLVGASMGGMIAQHVAVANPERVMSLTAIMSSSGAPGLPGPQAQVGREMGKRPATDLATATDRAIAFRRLLAGPLDGADAAELERRVRRSVAYGWPERAGAMRQYAAILADQMRHRLLCKVGTPTLVVHGGRDRLLPLCHGADLAARILGARFVAAPTMGHEILSSDGRRLASQIAAHLARARGAAAFPRD